MARRIKRKFRKINIISIVTLILTIVFCYYIHRLNVLPTKYLLLLYSFVVIVNVGIFALLNRKHYALKISGIVLAVLMVTLFSFGVYYGNRTLNFFNKSFGNIFNTYDVKYYVIAKNETTDDKIKKIGYYKEQPNIDEILKKVKKEYKKELVAFDELGTNVNDFMAGTVDAFLIESNLYEFIETSFDNFHKENYRVVKEFTVKVKEEIKSATDKNQDAINIYLGGTDFTNINTDFNMVVTINKKTNKILLTSIPRDYYINIPSKGKKDILSYSGVWGISSSIESVEDLLDINIDYYMKLNTNSLVGLVDELGGLEFCSDFSYTTTHAQILDSYDDSKGRKLRVQEGCHEYNGIQILTIARERKAFADGDNQRQKNCQTIIINIFKKMAQTNTLSNYTDILDAVSNLYTTNIPKDVVQGLIRKTVDGAKWEFVQQSLEGTGSDGYVHLGTIKDYVMIPNTMSVNNAKAKINKIYSK